MSCARSSAVGSRCVTSASVFAFFVINQTFAAYG
jgi:hypothetical protein